MMISHPNFGNEVRIEQYGKDVHLVFVAKTRDLANDLCDELLRQLQEGEIEIKLAGKPTSIIRDS
jgi:hypothetical protein